MRKKKGFTVIEVLFAVAILLILFALSYKSVFGAIQRAYDYSAAATMNNINSMYRMSVSFLFIDKEAHVADGTSVTLPCTKFSSPYEKALEKQMLSAFDKLSSLEYTLHDENGIANQGMVTITYYPYVDRPLDFYKWIDGDVYHIFNEHQEAIN